MRWRKGSASGAAALTAAMIAVAGCRGTRRAAAVPASVTVAAARVQAVPYEISAVGTVSPLQSVAVRSQVTGVLEHVAFREGDEVRQEDVLFRLDPRPYQAALAQAQAALARDAAQERNAQVQYDRARELAQSDAVTQDQLDQMRANAEGARAAVLADSAAVETAQLNLAYCTVHATISGRTGGLLVKEGNLVRTTDAMPLVVVNQMRPIGVTFAVPQRYLADIRTHAAGRSLAVRVQDPQDSSRTLAGRLDFLDNRVDTTTGTVTLRAVFPNADEALWPGAFVALRLELSVEPHAIVVPAPAVMSGQSGPYVFALIRGGRVETRPVVVGRAIGDEIVVEHGLSAGDTVVTDGQLRLTPGAAVTIRPGVAQEADPPAMP